MSSGAIIPARAPASIDMLQIVIRFSIERPRIAGAGVLEHVTDAAGHAEPADRAEDHVLRRDTRGQVAVEVDAHRARPSLRQALRREHVLDLGRADAERERAERAVCRGVAVAADDRHSGLRQAELRADHVDDSLPAAARREERHAELCAVLAQGIELRLGERIRHRPLLGRDVVIHRRERQIRPPDLPAGEPKAVESLGRGDLVDQVQIDEEDGRLALGLGHEMPLPDALEQRLRHSTHASQAGVLNKATDRS